MSRTWLNDLKLERLHRLATLVGSHCSGNKLARIQGIDQAVGSAIALTSSSRPKDGTLRIVSIDMGIRNLAFCSIKTPFPRATSGGLDSIKLDTWQRVEIAQAFASEKSTRRSKVPILADEAVDIPAATVKESFEPEVYAKYAYSFIKTIIDEHNPSHVLIERQRFRSGGGSAVQEWTIRVGVFEAMLYATIRTLVEEKYCGCTAVPMSPSMVNRFWLNGEMEDAVKSKEKAKKSNDIKKRKIQIAGEVLSSGWVEKTPMSLSDAASKTKEDFLAKLNGKKSPAPTTISKLDDLADSLLQGLAWISWQRNLLNLESLSKKEFGLP